MLRLGLVAFCLALSGCVSTPAPTRNEQLALTTREYPTATPEQVITAAETVLGYAKPSGLSFAHDQSGFTATIPYFIYVVIASETGHYVWRFDARPLPAGTAAEMHVSKSGTGTYAAPSPVIGGGGGVAVGAGSTAIGAQGLYTPTTDKLFWDRMDYLMGTRADWRKCRDIKFSREKGEEGGPDYFGLCKQGADYEPTTPARVAVTAK